MLKSFYTKKHTLSKLEFNYTVINISFYFVNCLAGFLHSLCVLCMSNISLWGKLVYYVATIVHVLWLAAERAIFSCHDWALLATIFCRCLKQIQYVFLNTKLYSGIHIMVNWQLSKKAICWPVSHDFIMGSSVQLIEVMCLLGYPLTSYWLLIVGSGPKFAIVKGTFLWFRSHHQVHSVQ